MMISDTVIFYTCAKCVLGTPYIKYDKNLTTI